MIFSWIAHLCYDTLRPAAIPRRVVPCHTLNRANRRRTESPHEEDFPVHEWYRFVLFSASPDSNTLISSRLITANASSTPSVARAPRLSKRKLGISSIGIEANPVVHFAASVKTDWDVDPQELVSYVEGIANQAQDVFNAQGIGYGPLFFSREMVSNLKRCHQNRNVCSSKTQLVRFLCIKSSPYWKCSMLARTTALSGMQSSVWRSDRL